MDSRGATAGQPHLGNGKGTNLLLEPGKISSGIPGESGNTDGQQCGGASYSAVLRWKEELEIKNLLEKEALEIPSTEPKPVPSSTALWKPANSTI